MLNYFWQEAYSHYLALILSYFKFPRKYAPYIVGLACICFSGIAVSACDPVMSSVDADHCNCKDKDGNIISSVDVIERIQEDNGYQSIFISSYQGKRCPKGFFGCGLYTYDYIDPETERRLFPSDTIYMMKPGPIYPGVYYTCTTDANGHFIEIDIPEASPDYPPYHFRPIPDSVYGDNALLFTSSANPESVTFTYKSTTKSVCTVDGDVLSFVGTGVCNVISVIGYDYNNYGYYSGSELEQSINVTKVPLTITADDFIITHGDTMPSFTATYEGFVNGDDATDLSGTLTFSTTGSPHTLGTYDINISGVTSDNYDITFQSGDFSIQSPVILVTQTDSRTAVTEGSKTDVVEIVPRTQVDSDVTVTARPDGQLDLGLGAGARLIHTFTSDNWKIPMQLTVSAKDDTEVEGNHLGKIRIFVDSTDWAFNNAFIADVKVYIADNDKLLPVSCERPKIYALQDYRLNDSQLFTIDPETLVIKALGGLYAGYDIEALDIHPITNELYAASGDDTATAYPHGYLYKVNPETGQLIELGSTGLGEVSAISFNPNDGSLWAWADSEGLYKITLDNGISKEEILASDLEIEGLTWDSQGQALYAVANRQLWRWTPNSAQAQLICNGLPSEVEALEMIDDDTLAFSVHDASNLNLYTWDITDANNCTKNFSVTINSLYNDVEGIAWPEACF